MKIKHIISSISTLACVLGGNCITINYVNAATFNFTYTLESTETISGSFDGDLQADGNTIDNLRDLNAEYSGVPGVTFDTLEVGNFFKIDLSEFQLSGRARSLPGAIFSAVRGNNGTEGIDVFIPSATIDGDSTIINDRFQVEMDEATTSQNIPEPGIILALALLGSWGCWQKLNQKHTPSRSARIINCSR